MNVILKVGKQYIYVFVFAICLTMPLLACQFATQLEPSVVQTENLSTPTIIAVANTAIIVPTKTPMGCPPEVLRELPNPDIAQNYIGQYLESNNVPVGLTVTGGQLVQTKGDVDHSWSQYKRDDDSYLLVWEKLHCRISGQEFYWEIVDAVITPPLIENQAVAIGCYRGDEFVPHVHAIIDINNYANIYFVWQVDVSSNKIIEIPVDGLSCSMGPEAGPGGF